MSQSTNVSRPADSHPGNDFGSSLRVLIAEQEQAVRDALVDRVEQSLGVTADAVNTAKAVRKLIEQHQGEYVLAVVDTRLPDAPNGEAIDILTHNAIPTIAISSNVTEEIAERLLDRHIIDCVLKRTDEDTDLLADLVQQTLCNPQRKILYFSENDFNRKKIHELLDIHRYTIIDVRNKTDVRRQLQEHQDISLVLLDQSTLQSSAISTISDLRQHYRREDLAIAAVCEQSDQLLGAKLLRAGANDVIRQPMPTDEFYYRVKNCVESVERVREIKYSATRDIQTGVYNRDYLFDIGEKLHGSAKRGDIKLTAAIIEIDNFEKITTRHGPETSNSVLEQLATLISNELRSNDIVARYDAAKFVCLANNVGQHNAIMVFERIRRLVAKTRIEFESTVLSVSCSIGATTDTDESFLSMIGNAQQTLIAAIEEGRNCAVVSGPNSSAVLGSTLEITSELTSDDF